MSLWKRRYRMPKAVGAIQRPPLELTENQQIIFDSEKPENLYSGAVGAGKSRILMEKAYQLARDNPGIRIGVFRKVRATLFETTIISALCHVNGWQSNEDPFGDYGFTKRWLKSEFKHILTNGSQIIFLGVDLITKLGSLPLASAFLDEAHEFDESDYDMIQTRLRQEGYPRLMFSACNPAAPTHWLYYRFFRDKTPERLMVQSNSYDNPHLPQDYLDRLSRLSGLFYRRMVLGEWVGFAGIIYDCFDAETHIIDEIPAPDRPENDTDGIWVRAIDYGGINPWVSQLWRITSRETMYLTHEIYMSGISAAAFAQLIIEKQSKVEVDYNVSDHDAADRIALDDKGIYTISALKDVKRGLEATHEKMNADEIFFLRDALDERDLKLTDDSGLIKRKRPQSTVEEIVGYEWNVTQTGVVKDEPMKRDDHGADSLRYCVMSRVVNSNRPRWREGRNV